MSWLSRSLVNSLVADHRSNGGGGGGSGGSADPKTRPDPRSIQSDYRSGVNEKDEEDPSRGVKEDLTELSQTLARQLWGVASFLAPPTNSYDVGEVPLNPVPRSEMEQRSEEFDSESIAGIRNNFAEIGGKFRSGISKLSGNMGVLEISKITSNFLPFRHEEEEEVEEEEVEVEVEGDDGNFGAGAIGITDEVMSFVHNISMHAETWLDFPLLSDDEDSDDFQMSDAQLEHAYTIDRLSPRLAALRIELCPNIMSEGSFWKTYFVLLHPRLSKQDAELLSTPQVVEARAMLLQKLQNQTKSPKLVDVSDGMPEISFPFSKPVIAPKDAFDTFSSENQQMESLHDDKHPNPIAASLAVINKTVAEEEPPNEPLNKFNVASNLSVEATDDDDWPEDEACDTTSGIISIPIDEDVSFSDLEEEDEKYAPRAPKR